MPVEQVRWNQSNIDTLFHAGSQSFVNQYFGHQATSRSNQFYFNLIQTPVNMITGYQRQHRKSIIAQSIDGSDNDTTDQYSKLLINISNKQGIHEQFSKACELSAIAGKCLLQPYLDYTGEDPAQGELKVKVWEYNSFLIDPYYRDQQNLSDCQFIWCQEYISKIDAEARFGDKVKQISPMQGNTQYGSFYFLPENYNMGRNDLMVISYVWYKWRKKKKRLYSKKRNQFFDFAGGDAQLEQILFGIDDMKEVTVETACWNLACVLNDQLMYKGNNPLWDGPECPFISVDWNYDPHIAQPDLRNRSLVRSMRDPNFLFNHKVISNNDIAASSINSGWIRKVGAVANEDNLKKAGQGWDVIINQGFELSDCQKIIPNAVPESDLALAEQMSDLLFKVSGINLENWSGQNDKHISSLTLMLKQSANLMVFQKYFDQWDHNLKNLGELILMIALSNWNAEKVKLIIGEEPTAFFYSKVFAKYKTIVEEGLLTQTQRNMQAQKKLEINERFGREVFPPSMIIKDMDIQGKGEILQFMKQQEEQASEMQMQNQIIAQTHEEAKLKELYSKVAKNIASAREDHSRSESNLGLYEERLSMIERNRALSLKEKQAAITALLENIQKFGQIEQEYASNQIEIDAYQQRTEEEIEKADVERRTGANKFLAEIMGSLPNNNQTQQEMPQQEMPQQEMQQEQQMPQQEMQQQQQM